MENLNRSWAVVVGLWAAVALGQVGQVWVPVPPNEGPGETGLSPPVLVGASNCSASSWRLSLLGGFPGGEYQVFEQQGPITNTLGVFPVKPNADGATVVDVIPSGASPIFTARQVLNGVTSPFSAPLTSRPPTKLPAPELPYVPLFECGWATYVAGHQPGDQVTLLSHISGTRSFIPSAFGTSDYMPAGNRPFVAGEKISVQYSTCQGPPQTSPVSAPSTVELFPSRILQAPEPRTESLFPGVTRFAVGGVVNGATLHLVLDRNGSTTNWTERCATDVCTAFIPSSVGAFVEGDVVVASQELCAGTLSPTTEEKVRGCDDVLPPVLASVPAAGDTSVALSQAPLGATVRVYVTKNQDPQKDVELIGYAFDTALVPLTRAIEADDRWVVVVLDTGACSPRRGAGYFVGRR